MKIEDFEKISNIFPITKEDLEIIKENDEEYFSIDECNINQFD